MPRRLRVVLTRCIQRAAIDVAERDDFHFGVAGHAFHRASTHAPTPMQATCRREFGTALRRIAGHASTPAAAAADRRRNSRRFMTMPLWKGMKWLPSAGDP